MDEIVKVQMATAAQAKKPLVLGEFGSQTSTVVGQEQAQFNELMTSIENNKVPLALLWVYDYAPQESSWNVTPYNSKKYQLDAIVSLNQKIRVQLGL
jgi:hypothetical protein